jgi:hypothetical protein
MKKRGFLRILLGSFLCTGSILGLGCDTIFNTHDIIAEATELIGKGQNEAAIDILRPYIYKNHDSFKAHFLAGQAFLNLNLNDEKNLYLARHYFSSASKLASNEGKRLQADQAYADVRLIMAKSGKSADTLLKAADRTNTIGNSEQATSLYLQAAYRFIQDENYDDAIDSCQKGLQNNSEIETGIALTCTLARALFLNEDYYGSLDVLRALENSKAEISAIHDSEMKFIQVASQALLMKSERNLLSLNPLKKQFGNAEEQLYVDAFIRSLNGLKRMETIHGEDQKALIGQYSLILARHSKSNDMPTLAKQAYEYSRNVFSSAGLEKKAFGVGEEIRDLES